MKKRCGGNNTTMSSWVKAVFSCSMFLFFAGNANATQQVYSDWTLTQDYNENFIIEANNVTLDLNGHSINNPYGNGIGITAINKSNIRITGGGTVNNFATGIYFEGGGGNYVINCHIYSVDWGIVFNSSDGGFVHGGTIYAENYDGILNQDASYAWILSPSIQCCGRCAIIDLYTTNTEFNDVLASGNGSDGICISWECSNFLAKDCSTIGNQADGMSFYGCSGEISNNVSTYNQGYGFGSYYGSTIDRSDGNTAYRNVLGDYNW